MTAAERLVRCHYWKPNADAQCTAEAVDPDGEILLCTRHLGRALALITRQRLLIAQRAAGR